MKILSRSMGYVEKGRFTGDIIFHLQAEGKVLNPPAGLTLQGIVIRKNKMGMYVSYNDAIRIILPRDLHIGDEVFEAVQVGATVNVEIQKSRFQVNDPYILSVGLFRGLVEEAPAAADAAASEAPVAAEAAAPSNPLLEEAPAAPRTNVGATNVGATTSAATNVNSNSESNVSESNDAESETE
jgi:hypothetical protein